ncbi:RRQRL motif-containing zinc-binding protein [Streptomyces sp. NPDC088197]|uniref:RRQRL motif-containing zinc-binding protein n=1 Tax=unclassified Streptomyces TaxID=2593676 RepID=UPI0036E17F7F
MAAAEPVPAQPPDSPVVDVDPYDPGDGSLPVFPWKQAGYKGLATRRQLRAKRLRPGGQAPVARIECRGGTRWAWLYRVDLALPIRPMTLAKEIALDAAMAKRQTCPKCQRRFICCLPLKTLGSCLECDSGIPLDPRLVMFAAPGPAPGLAA